MFPETFETPVDFCRERAFPVLSFFRHYRVTRITAAALSELTKERCRLRISCFWFDADPGRHEQLCQVDLMVSFHGNRLVVKMDTPLDPNPNVR